MVYLCRKPVNCIVSSNELDAVTSTLQYVLVVRSLNSSILTIVSSNGMTDHLEVSMEMVLDDDLYLDDEDMTDEEDRMDFN